MVSGRKGGGSVPKCSSLDLLFSSLVWHGRTACSSPKKATHAWSPLPLRSFGLCVPGWAQEEAARSHPAPRVKTRQSLCMRVVCVPIPVFASACVFVCVCMCLCVAQDLAGTAHYDVMRELLATTEAKVMLAIDEYNELFQMSHWHFGDDKAS